MMQINGPIQGPQPPPHFSILGAGRLWTMLEVTTFAAGLVVVILAVRRSSACQNPGNPLYAAAFNFYTLSNQK